MRTLCLIIIACLGSQTKVPCITFHGNWVLGAAKVPNTRGEKHMAALKQSPTPALNTIKQAERAGDQRTSV